MKLQKKWGQYILIDETVIKKAVNALQLSPRDTVFEIGPGTGALSLPIKESGAQLLTVEIDSMMCAILEGKGIKTVNMNFLEMNLTDLPQSVKIISALPYYITTLIINKIFAEKVPFSIMVLIMQKEVADKVTADPGSKDYGLISVLVQFNSVPEIVSQVPRSCFNPVPDVDSCIVKFQKRTDIKLDFPEEFLFKVIKAGFLLRRKMLHNALKSFGSLDGIDIDLKRRAEDLSIEEFCNLANKLWKRR